MCLFSLKGEVLRIRVPFSGEVSPAQAEGGGAHQLLLPDIERQAKEISPRYNGHKVTIQVRYPLSPHSRPMGTVFVHVSDPDSVGSADPDLDTTVTKSPYRYPPPHPVLGFPPLK
jgi:hypothetical protein